jgi:hypothetical protein
MPRDFIPGGAFEYHDISMSAAGDQLIYPKLRYAEAYTALPVVSA